MSNRLTLANEYRPCYVVKRMGSKGVNIGFRSSPLTEYMPRHGHLAVPKMPLPAWMWNRDLPSDIIVMIS